MGGGLCPALLMSLAIAAAAILAASPTPALSEGTPGDVTIRCLYNRWSGEHLFTTNQKGYRRLTGIGWNSEDEAWRAPAVRATTLRGAPTTLTAETTTTPQTRSSTSVWSKSARTGKDARSSPLTRVRVGRFTASSTGGSHRARTSSRPTWTSTGTSGTSARARRASPSTHQKRLAGTTAAPTP